MGEELGVRVVTCTTSSHRSCPGVTVSPDLFTCNERGICAGDALLYFQNGAHILHVLVPFQKHGRLRLRVRVRIRFRHERFLR